MRSHMGGVWESHMGVANGTPTYGTYGTDGESACERANPYVPIARTSNGQIYLVHWPAAGFYKLGVSVDERRWKPYLRRGGLLVALAEPIARHASVVEEEMHKRIDHLPRAFRRKADAAPYVGHGGAGWTECFVFEGGDELLAKLIQIDEEYARRRGA